VIAETVNYAIAGIGFIHAVGRLFVRRGFTTSLYTVVKQNWWGLCDLQRALSVNTLASGRPAALAEPALIEAHRFLWLVRCHLHLLVGRAEDRLSSALQPDVTRRRGFDEPRGTTAALPLRHIFRRHAHNVLQAAALATGSIPAQPR